MDLIDLSDVLDRHTLALSNNYRIPSNNIIFHHMY